jgi:hypothetical protein
MDANHLVTINWWIGGLKCIMFLILAYFIYHKENGRH